MQLKFLPETRIFWVTGSTGDCMHQIAAIDCQFRRNRTTQKKIFWYILLPNWAEEFRYLVSTDRCLVVTSINTRFHNLVSYILKRAPYLRFACIPNHLYHSEILSRNGMQIDGEAIERYSPFQKAMAIISRSNFDDERKFIWQLNPKLSSIVKENKSVVGNHTVLINPLSHTHLGFSKDIWKSIAETIRDIGYMPVFTLGKSISKNSFGYQHANCIRMLVTTCGFKLIETSPLELIVMGRLARYVITGMGGSCSLVHDFRFDPQLQLNDERNCIILWSKSRQKFHSLDRRTFIIDDYDETTQEEIHTRSSQKDCTYRHFVETKTRLSLSGSEIQKIRSILGSDYK